MSYDFATSLPATIRSAMAALSPKDACQVARSIRDAIDGAETKAHARALIERLPGLTTLHADWETEVTDEAGPQMRWSSVLVDFADGRRVSINSEREIETGEHLNVSNEDNADWLKLRSTLEEVDEPDLLAGEADARIAARALGVSLDDLGLACSSIWALVEVAEHQMRSGPLDVAYVAQYG